MSRGSQPNEPVLTAEEVAAQRAAQEQRIRELASRLVDEKMQEQEAKIRIELEESQQRIADLQKKLQDSQKEAPTAAEKKEIQRLIQAEEEKQRLIEAEKEKQRQAALAQAQKEAEAQAELELAAAAAAAAVPTPVEVAQTEATAVPQVVEPTAVPVSVTENQFVDPSEVDTLPAIIKEESVKWPQSAKRARRRGMVICQATVDASGRVESVKVLRADEDGFGIPEAVTDAIKKYIFKPGTKDGIKIKTHATVTKRYAFR